MSAKGWSKAGAGARSIDSNAPQLEAASKLCQRYGGRPRSKRVP